MFTNLVSTRRMALVVLAAAGACSDAATNRSSRPLTVSVTTKAQGALADRSLADITIVANGDSLVITKAQLVARRIELAPVEAVTCAGTGEQGNDDGNSTDGCADVEVGATLVDLPLDASTKTNLTASVPAGTYRALDARIGPIKSGNRRSSDFLIAHPEFRDASVRVEGTFNGKPFVFTSAVDARIEMEFSTPVTVDATNTNVTVAIDLAAWFSDGLGGMLDPSSSANASSISSNIARSFRAFEDENHDGQDDSHR